MLKITFWISALILVNISLWYVNVSVVMRRVTSCQEVRSSSVISSSSSKHRYRKFVLPFKAKTKYPQIRDIRYLLNNESICNTTRPVTLLYVVSSSPQHYSSRKLIRSTFANSSYFRYNIVRVAFFVGRTRSISTQSQIRKEHRRYGDIIQVDFIDAYRNLTLKVVSELHWVKTFCPKVQIVAKIDDDAFVDTVLFLLKYKSYLRSGRYDILGNRLSTFILRDGKWGVLDSMFRGYKSFPWTFCSGYVVFMKGKLIGKLLKSAAVSPFFWIDDLYLSGILPSRINGVRAKQIPNFLDVYKNKIGCFMNKTCKDVFGLIRSSSVPMVWNYTIKEKHGIHMLRV